MMDILNTTGDLTGNIDFVVIAISIGLLVAVITELVKAIPQFTLNTQQLQLVNLFAGWVLGLGYMVAFGGDFTTYTILGLVGGVMAPGIYDVIIKGLNVDRKDWR